MKQITTNYSLIFFDKDKNRNNTFRWIECSYRAFVPSVVALSLIASFFATATPLDTTTAVVQSLRRQKQ